MSVSKPDTLPGDTVRKVIDNLGWLFGALSIVLLARQGFQFGLVAPLAHALDYYEKLIHILLGWSEPYLNNALRWTGWNLRLFPHWKHVLVLMWLYFGSVAKVIWPVYKSHHERILLVALTSWGGLISIGASLAAGTVALKDRQSNWSFVVFPLVGFLLYQLAWAAFLATLGHQETWRNRFRAASRLYLGPSTIAVISIAIILGSFAGRLRFLAAQPNPGLTLLFVLVLVLAFRWLWTGIDGAVRFHTPNDGSWWQTFHSMKWKKSWRVTSNARIGFSMLKAIGGAVSFILLGAGLE